MSRALRDSRLANVLQAVPKLENNARPASDEEGRVSKKRRRNNSDENRAVKRQRSTNSLLAEIQPTQDYEPSPDLPNVTSFDEMRAQQLAGVYMPPEYVQEIVKTMNEDSTDKCRPDYFKFIQSDLKPRMRTILCGWLTEVASKLRLKDLVLWTTFDLIDRYLATTEVKRNDFQLLGCAAMWVASKYHEIYPPAGADLVYMSDGAFDKEQLIRMEAALCDELDYDFTGVNAYQHLERFTNIAIQGFAPCAHKELDRHMKEDPTSTNVSPLVKKAKRIKFLARYSMERYNLHPNSVGRPEKHIAAMALYTALCLTSNKWTKDLEKATGLTGIDLREEKFIGGSFKEHKKVVLDFGQEQHRAIIRKYKLPEFGSVSTLRKKKTIPQF